jgi:hypothetical protein
MKVLHLPVNIASQISATVRALKDIGIDARGLVFNNTDTQDGLGIETYKIVSRREHPFSGIKQSIPFWLAAFKAIRRADVIHWHYSERALPFGLDLRMIARMNKAAIVEFWGSDIRIPEIAIADNPFMARLYESYPQMKITMEQSRRTQQRFADFGFECLIPGNELLPYVQKDIFPSPYKTVARVILSDFDPKYPDPDCTRPVVLHAPSHRGKKFSDHIIRTVSKLQEKYDIEFRLITGLKHSEAIAAMRECDLLIDEVAPGDYGLAAIEAMALGKPSLNYIKPSIRALLPEELPIVNANVDTLAGQLEKLATDGKLRHEIGRRGRQYVEKYHDAHKVAHQLVGIYEELLAKKRR